jgi:hypothetical protein
MFGVWRFGRFGVPLRGFRIYNLVFEIIPFVVCGSDARIKDL